MEIMTYAERLFAAAQTDLVPLVLLAFAALWAASREL